jgi:hypothetical protein
MMQSFQIVCVSDRRSEYFFTKIILLAPVEFQLMELWDSERCQKDVIKQSEKEEVIVEEHVI